MKRSSYRERNYVFGQAILTLRKAIGLNQTELAELLGVSRYAIGDWEAGDKYPKVEHLKQLIRLAAQQNAFPAGHEAEEIRTLWKLAHQKVLLDEHWLAALLSEAPSIQTGTRVASPSASAVRRDWGDALSISAFYGREQELEMLTQWVIGDRCQVVSVFGQGGIGKSALAVTLMRQVADNFDVVVWRSLRDAPTCESLLDGCLQVLSPQFLTQTVQNIEERLQLLFDYLRGQRALIVLDNVESILENGDLAGRMRDGYESYASLLQRMGETAHQSCLLLTSRETPVQLAPLEGSQSRVKTLRLTRLEFAPCEQLLSEKSIAGTSSENARLIELYAGNPLALKIVAQTIVDLFGGDIAPFLDQDEIIFGNIRNLLAEQFIRLSALEQSVLMWLAILREPSTLNELLAVTTTPVSRGRLLEALQSLYRRALIERGQRSGSFTLQSVVLEYLTVRLIEELSDEIQQGKFSRLIEHGLELAHASEYVRQTQELLLGRPILSHLQVTYPEPADLENVLTEHLRQLRGLAKAAQGYAPATLLVLLYALRGHLRGLDLSRLALRDVYLQGIDMQDTNLRETSIQDCLFTESFDGIISVAISRNGDTFATTSVNGEARLWKLNDFSPELIWQSFSDTNFWIALSSDGQKLACGTGYGVIKIWNVRDNRLLVLSDGDRVLYNLGFSPDDRTLVATWEDGNVHLLDATSGLDMQVLPHKPFVFGIAWSPDGRILATGDFGGVIRLWRIDPSEPATCVQVMTGHQQAVHGLAFSPDGSTLASAGADGTIRLWNVASGNQFETLNAHTGGALRVLWTANGNTLVSCGRDGNIILWDVQQTSYHRVLRRHTGAVRGLGATPEGRYLVSGGWEGTLRVWEIATGKCVRVLQGFESVLNSLDWSPDGRHLVSGGTDSLVTLYSLNDATPPRILHKLNSEVFGVRWSPDGRFLATAERRNTIRLWDMKSGECIQTLQHADDSTNQFFRLSWSPDSQRLAAGTARHGIMLWNVDGSTLHSSNDLFPTMLDTALAWSPDGTQIACVGQDSTIYIWSANGELTQKIVGYYNPAWNSDGTQLATIGVEDGLYVWDAKSGERLLVIADIPNELAAVMWGAEDHIVITAQTAGTIQGWDLNTGDCLWKQSGHHGSITELRRSPDASKLASCGDDGAVRVWNLNTGEHLRTMRLDRPYERLDITGIRGLTAVQKATLRILGAIEDGVP